MKNCKTFITKTIYTHSYSWSDVLNKSTVLTHVTNMVEFWFRLFCFIIFAGLNISICILITNYIKNWSWVLKNTLVFYKEQIMNTKDWKVSFQNRKVPQVILCHEPFEDSIFFLLQFYSSPEYKLNNCNWTLSKHQLKRIEQNIFISLIFC